MTTPLTQRAPQRPWRPGRAYVTLLGVTIGVVLCLVFVPTGPGPGAAERKMWVLAPAVAVFDLLLAAPVVMGIARRRFWRSYTAPAADLLLGVVLSVLTVVAIVINFAFVCGLASLALHG
jgi:hypothetical protein